jgi:hypothetical protein
MSTLLIVIRESRAGTTAQSLRPFICPYFAVFGATVKIVATRTLAELRNDGEGQRVTIYDVEVENPAAKDLGELAKSVERSLKQTSKDAKLAAVFEMFHLQQITDQQNGEDFG